MPFKNPEKRRQYARKYRDDHLEEARQSFRERKEALRDEVRKIKEKSGCIDCGQKFRYYILQFDHKPGQPKVEGISRLTNSLDRELVLEEIKKCDVVCANCHAERTFCRMKRA